MDKKTTDYTAPVIETILMQAADIIATSGINESYDEGSTDGWFEN